MKGSCSAVTPCLRSITWCEVAWLPPYSLQSSFFRLCKTRGESMFCNQPQTKTIGFLYISFRFQTRTQSKAAACHPHTALRKNMQELKSCMQPVAAVAHTGGYSLAGAFLPVSTRSPLATMSPWGGGQVPKRKATLVSHALQS